MISLENLDQAFEVKSKIDFLLKHYVSANDVLIGVSESLDEAYQEAEKKLAELGWKKEGDVEFISFRIDMIQDWFMPDYLKQIRAPNVYETIEQMEERTGKKCYGTKKYYYTSCVCRRFKNPMNIYIYDDEINGATPICVPNAKYGVEDF